jgi:hypothetical protein
MLRLTEPQSVRSAAAPRLAVPAARILELDLGARAGIKEKGFTAKNAEKGRETQRTQDGIEEGRTDGKGPGRVQPRIRRISRMEKSG